MSRKFLNKRYSENWPKVSRYCKQLTGGKCVLCDRAAKETHHVRYRDGRGAIAGREKPGRDIFPLCEYHHSDLAPDCAHHPNNWERDFKNFLNNKNSYKFQRKLKDAWQEKIASRQSGISRIFLSALINKPPEAERLSSLEQIRGCSQAQRGSS